MIKYEVFENNGGGVFLVILDGNSQPMKIFENWEYVTEKGSLLSAIAELKADPMAWKNWDGDLMENLEVIGSTETIEQVYENLGDLVAWSGENGEMENIPVSRIGFAARKCLDVQEENDDY